MKLHWMLFWLAAFISISILVFKRSFWHRIKVVPLKRPKAHRKSLRKPGWKKPFLSRLGVIECSRFGCDLL